MTFFKLKEKNKFYPLFILVSAIAIMVIGLIFATNIKCSYFLGGLFIWIFIFCKKEKALRALLSYIVVAGILSTISFYVNDNSWSSFIAMANRFGAVFMALLLGMNVEPYDMVRCLSTLRFPRSITLGILIATSFPSSLKEEIKRVKEAMRTRGAGNILNIKVFYRAFLIPFVMRLVNISDTLSLSIETRGYSLESKKYTVYKKSYINFLDVIFLLGIIGASIGVIIL